MSWIKILSVLKYVWANRTVIASWISFCAGLYSLVAKTESSKSSAGDALKTELFETIKVRMGDLSVNAIENESRRMSYVAALLNQDDVAAEVILKEIEK